MVTLRLRLINLKIRNNLNINRKNNVKSKDIIMNSYFEEFVKTQTLIGKRKMDIIEDFLTVNEYSRPGFKLNDLKAVVVHWVANPGSTAKATRDYFETLKNVKKYASTQYVVGISGEIIQMMPDNERAYHVGTTTLDPASGRLYTDLARKVFGEKYCTPPYSPSYACIGIETCHKDWTGKFNNVTLNSLVQLVVSLFKKYPDKLTDPLTQVIRHYDVVGWKECPLWFVKNPLDFDEFKQTVTAQLNT
jgi:N-acetylmuramoyl-L-alanine amidase